MNANSYNNQKIRGLKRKYEYIMSRGGKCECCGYNKNISALDFHHKNPLEKEFQIDARKFANTNLDDLKTELDKCMLLCANCHREIRHPELSSVNVLLIIENSNKKSFSNKDTNVSICPECGKTFKKMKGKIYCSKECRYNSNKYPSFVEINFQYSILGSWDKVAEHFGLTRKIIQGIRKKQD